MSNLPEHEEVLQQYAEENLPEFIGMLLTSVHQRGHFGNTPLHIACVRGNISEVSALINAGADVNAVGELDSSPLHNAVAEGHQEVVRVLLGAGANTASVNSFGDTPIILAAKHGLDGLVRMMTEEAT
jgi:uncharacterized protein